MSGTTGPIVRPDDEGNEFATEGGLRAPPGLTYWGRIWWWFHFLILVKLARLRFVAVLVGIGAFIIYWDTFKAYYDRWTRPAHSQTIAESGTEWFCPMHPQIIRDNPKDKCPICFMPLSKRQKGEASADPLPAGTVSRIQLSPYRIALAGVRTFEVGYRVLNKEVTTIGTVEFDERRLSRITVRPGGKSRIDKLYVNVTGQSIEAGDPLALIYNPQLATTAQNLIDAQRSGNKDMERDASERLRLWGIDNDQIAEILRTRQSVTHLTVRSPVSGHVYRKYQVEGEYVEEGARLFDVADVSTVWIEAQVYEEQIALLSESVSVRATTTAFPGREFEGRVALIQPHLDPATRTVRVRFNMDNPRHELRPGMYATVRLRVPIVGLEQFTRATAESWAQRVVRYQVGGDEPGLDLLVDSAAEEARLRQGLVLAVPEGAVIDTGSRKVVYREVSAGVYEGVEVELGPRCDLYYPVARGLSVGDHVVTTGSFLIDAETRLNPAAGSIYLGGSSGSKATSAVTKAQSPSSANEEDEIRTALAQLNPEDRRLAESQRLCPVLGTRLGSMGAPTKIILQGRPAFLCCRGCDEEAKADPAKTLARVDQLLRGEKLPGAAK